MRIFILFLTVSFAFMQGDEISSKANMLKSLAIPGWGQHKLESNTRARVFFSSEVLLFSGWFISKNLASQWEDDYSDFALQHAGVNLSGKDYNFAVDIGNYDSLQEYNQEKTNYRVSEERYPENQGNEWQWDSRANRESFEDMRIKSGTANKTASFFVAAIVVNHFSSAIDALLLERKNMIPVEATVHPQKNGASLNIALRF